MFSQCVGGCPGLGLGSSKGSSFLYTKKQFKLCLLALIHSYLRWNRITSLYSSVHYRTRAAIGCLTVKWAVLGSYMANQVNVVVEMPHKVIRDVVGCAASVSDELPLGHFVFDVGAGQVDGQQDQTVAQDVDRV